MDYEPAESSTGLFGGNSNWRGPIWMPVNILLIRGLITFYDYFGDTFTIECPTGSGQQMTLWQVAEEISHRLASIFLRDAKGRRPVFGETATFQTNPHWRDYRPVLRVFSWRQRRGHRRESSDGLDGNNRRTPAPIRDG